MKPLIAFYDVPTSGESVYRGALGGEFRLRFTHDPLTKGNVDLARDATILCVHSTSHATSSLLEQMPALRHVSCRTTGFDHVDLNFTSDHNISVSTVPAYGQDTVAEYTFALMLALARKLIPSVHAAATGKIVTKELVGHDLNGKILGVIGTGRIGQKVTGIGRAFGMRVIAYDPYENASAATEYGYTYCTLVDLISTSDYISLHAPATSDNLHLLSSDQFSEMKDGVIVINTARGSLIDTPALIAALKSGKVAGVGLDVIEGEELLETRAEQRLDSSDDSDKTRHARDIDILLKLPNAIITSHNAYNSVEALGRIAQTTIDNILAWQKNQPQNLVKK